MSEELPSETRWLASGTVYVAAMAWPWGAYGQVYYGHGLFSAALGVLGLALVVSWVREGRLGIPFDLLWPTLLLGGGAAAFWAMGERAVSPGVVVGCGAFLLALSGATNRTVVYRALAVSSLSAGCVAVLTVLVEFNYVFPTFFARQGGAVGAGPTNLPDALVLFAWFALTALALFAGRRQLLWKVGAWLLPVAALCCGTAFFFLARRLQDDFLAWNPNFGALAFPVLPLILLALYVVSRAAARVFVLAEPRLVCPQTGLGAMLLLFSLALAFAGHFAPSGLCFSFGLVAALGVPRTLRETDPVRSGWAWVVVIPVMAAHAFVLFPGDARDYVQGGQRAQAEGEDRVDYFGRVLGRFPGESRARLELATEELKQGNVEAASDSFLGVIRERRISRVFDSPDPESVAVFLAQVKEHGEGVGGIGYERCLVGAGRAKEAATTLKSRVKPGPDVDIDEEPLRRALGNLLGIQGGEADFGDWSAAELLAALQLCGPYCQSVQAPPEIPRRYLPAVLASRPLHDGRMVTVFYPGGQTGRSWRMNACSGNTPGEGETWWLDPVLDEETGEWYAALAGSADVDFGNELRVSLIEDASLDCGPGAGGWAVMCLLP